MQHINVYGYQFREDTEVEVTTKSGQKYSLKKVTPDTLGIIMKKGRKQMLTLDNEIIIKDYDEKRGSRSATIPIDKSLLVVSDSTRRKKIGSFGFPVEGIRTGHHLELWGDFGLITTVVKRIEGENVQPDEITQKAIALTQKYCDEEALEAFQKEMDLTREELWRLNVDPYRLLNDTRQSNLSLLRVKVGAMVMGLIRSIEMKELTLTEGEIDEFAETVAPFVQYQCFNPFLHKMVKIYKKTFTTENRKNQLTAHFRTDDNQIAGFSLEHQPIGAEQVDLNSASPEPKPMTLKQRVMRFLGLKSQ